MLKKYSLLAGVFYTLVLTALSLIKLSVETPNLPSFNDKIVHGIAHLLFVILWFIVFNYRFKLTFNKAILYAALFSIAYGVLIELLQGLITVSRQSDVNDVIANTIGMVFAVVLLLSVKIRVLKNINTLLF